MLDKIKNISWVQNTLFFKISSFYAANRLKSILSVIFLLVMLPVAVVAALTVTNTRQHAAGKIANLSQYNYPNTYGNVSSDGQWEVAATYMYNNITVNQPDPFAAYIASSKYPDSPNFSSVNTVKIDCDLDPVGKQFFAQHWRPVGKFSEALYRGYRVDNNINYLTIQGNLGVSHEEFQAAYPGKTTGNFIIQCFATAKSPTSGLVIRETPITFGDNLVVASVTVHDTTGAPVSSQTSCPSSQTRVYSTGQNKCDGSTGLGFNTVGGSYVCGPVLCPEQKPDGKTPEGNTCIYKQGQQCFAGYGGGGFAPSKGEGGCTYNQTYPTPIPCPQQDYTVSIRVVDSVDKNTGVGGIVLQVDDNGRLATVTTDVTGLATFKSYSGDHFTVWPVVNTQNTQYTFSINQAKPVSGVVNTSWACGTQTGWPTPDKANAPCAIIATSVGLPTPTPTPTEAPTPTLEITPPSTCSKQCPVLPATCHYNATNTCCVPQSNGECSCPSFSCQ